MKDKHCLSFLSSPSPQVVIVVWAYSVDGVCVCVCMCRWINMCMYVLGSEVNPKCHSLGAIHFDYWDKVYHLI